MSNEQHQSSKQIELAFVLNVEDGWPPVAIEGLPATLVKDGYRVETPPLFVKGLSVGDVIQVVRDAGGNVSSWSHLSKSRRTTIWLLRIAKLNSDEIQRVLKELRALKCNTVQLPRFGSYSIDVPEDCAIEDVDACLEKVDQTRVAIAYPSFRHERT